MTTWMRAAWAHRERIVAAARKLKLPLRVWVALAFVAMLLAAAYWGFTRGYILWNHPTSWPPAQWALMGVNVVGFTFLYFYQRSWWNRQDEVWDEVAQLREELDSLREQLHAATVGKQAPQEQPAAVEELPTIDALPSARPKVPELPLEEQRTEMFRAVRAEPTGENEVPTVERVIGGRTFNFRG